MAVYSQSKFTFKLPDRFASVEHMVSQPASGSRTLKVTLEKPRTIEGYLISSNIDWVMYVQRAIPPNPIDAPWNWTTIRTETGYVSSSSPSHRSFDVPTSVSYRYRVRFKIYDSYAGIESVNRYSNIFTHK